MQKFLASLLVTLTLATSAFAQAVHSNQHNVNGPLMAAAFEAVMSPELSLKPSPAVAPRQIPAKSPNWAARHPALLGALIGMAVGGVAGRDAYFCPGVYINGGSGDCRAEGLAWGIGVGAGVGAGAGALLGKLFSR
jgi:hypothetical protein